jgi:hypothetical protein
MMLRHRAVLSVCTHEPLWCVTVVIRLVVASVWCTGVVDDAGVQRPPGLRLSSLVAVPSLSIPASRVEVVVAGSNSVVQPNITMQWTSSISPVRFVNLTGVTLTVSQGAGSVSGSVRPCCTCMVSLPVIG